MKPLVRYATDWRRLQTDFNATRTLAHSNPYAAGEELVNLEIQAGWLTIHMISTGWAAPECPAVDASRYTDLLSEKDHCPLAADDPYELGGEAAMEFHQAGRQLRSYRSERIVAGLPDDDEDLDTWPACVLRSNVIGGGGHFHASRARAFSQVCAIMAEECEGFEIETGRDRERERANTDLSSFGHPTMRDLVDEASIHEDTFRRVRLAAGIEVKERGGAAAKRPYPSHEVDRLIAAAIAGHFMERKRMETKWAKWATKAATKPQGRN